MKTPIISVENLGKSYQLGLKAATYPTFRDALVGAATSPLRRMRRLSGRAHDDEQEKFWALKDVSFEVNRGEVLGIIGRNGAGKSTLLKILSRITEPTTGRAVLRGRVASLLEVGTGFHPELTGRENIYLNGSILGMKKAEIDRKFDEIVAFAEIEKFLDTPVKRYSSGMYVRLAFAVAAHLEPEILIVDEVLAVGDAEFQKKCLGKMREVAQGQGRTVLFVSHNLGAVQQLCSRGIFLRNGCLVLDGRPGEAIHSFLTQLTKSSDNAFSLDNADRTCSGEVRLTGGRILSHQNVPTRTIIAGEPLVFEFDFTAEPSIDQLDVTLTVFNHLGIAVTNVSTKMTDGAIRLNTRQGQLRCALERTPFPPGDYRVAIALSVRDKRVDLIPNALVFDVAGSVYYRTAYAPDICFCAVMIDHRWQCIPVGEPATVHLGS